MGGGGESWSLTAKLCDSCKTSAAALFCRTDSAFLCMGCDHKVHAASKLGSRHARVWVCDVCEQAPASVTCKADAAALCVACDRDIHSANPLARRHERFPVVPFYDSPPPAAAKHYAAAEGDGGGGSCFSDSEEAEAASWLLPNPNPSSKALDHGQLKSSDYLFSDIDPCFDLDLMAGEQKQKPHQHQHQNQYGSTDGVVPVGKNMMLQQQAIPSVVDGVPVCYDHMDDFTGSKPFLYNFTSQSFSQSVSSSSLEVGVVPDHNAMADVSTANTLSHRSSGETVAAPVSGADREAKVLRYREKRKNRKFEKLIRYASRKAYAETRPRIKGRFAKRSEVVDLDCVYTSSPMDAGGYSVVPTF